MDSDKKGWRYSINYGPDGEENWANLTTPDGEHVANIRTHHAMAIVQGLNSPQPLPPAGKAVEATAQEIAKRYGGYEPRTYGYNELVRAITAALSVPAPGTVIDDAELLEETERQVKRMLAAPQGERP